MKTTTIKHLATVAMAALMVSFSSCTDKLQPDNEIKISPEDDKADLELHIGGLPDTKATDTATRNGEDNIRTASVYVFDADEKSSMFGLLEAYKEAEDATADRISVSISLTATTGKKHIYVVGNDGVNMNSGAKTLSETITTEEELKAAISDFSDNAGKSFVMVGATEASLVPGHAKQNILNLNLRRLVARISIGDIIGDFDSPALRQSRFWVKRVYLVNVPKQAKYINGDYTDAFGSGATAPKDAPAGFLRSGDLPYYAYVAPAENASENGFYNWADPGKWTESSTLEIESTKKNVPVLTSLGITENKGKLYEENGAAIHAIAGHKLTLNQDFYCYPNSSVPFVVEEGMTEDQIKVDYTTKLVVETEVTINKKNYTYYYPISIPYVQPNYAYKIGSITLKRLGSKDPFHPVSSAECDFSITVKPWEAGEIGGKDNGKDSDGNFVI